MDTFTSTVDISYKITVRCDQAGDIRVTNV
jgi:hypothetical protein